MTHAERDALLWLLSQATHIPPCRKGMSFCCCGLNKLWDKLHEEHLVAQYGSAEPVPDFDERGPG